MPDRSTDLEALLRGTGVVALTVPDPEESLMAALPVLLALDARDREVVLVPPTMNGRWAPHVADWLGTLQRPLSVALEVSHASLVIRAGHAGLVAEPAPDRADRPALEAIVGLGAESALGVDPVATERVLAQRASEGELLGVEPILRFGPVGRAFIELVEHVHHLSGPMDQSVVADSVRAALFGRAGETPVSLTTRARPPRLGPATTLIWFLRPREPNRIG